MIFAIIRSNINEYYPADFIGVVVQREGEVEHDFEYRANATIAKLNETLNLNGQWCYLKNPKIY